MRADLVTCSEKSGLCRFLTFNRTDISESAIQRDRKILRILGSIGVPLAVAFHGGVGALFGVVEARPYWHGGHMPIAFLIGALASGGALLAFVTAIWGPNRGTEENRKLVVFLGKIVMGLLAFDLLLEWAEYSIGIYSSLPSEAQSLSLVLTGEFWWVFWVVHIALGTAVPLALLIFRGKSAAAVATAGALIAFTFLTVRLNIVIPGLAIEELEGLRTAFSGPGLSFDYFPSIMEWLFFIWTCSMAGLAFMIGDKLLPISRTKEVA